MTQIEEINKLYAKGTEFKIPTEPKEEQEQVSLTITPLSLEDMSVMDFKEDAPISEISKNAIKMFSLSLRITEAEAGKISFEYLNDILNAVLKVNNFDETDKTKVNQMRAFIDSKKNPKKVNDTDGVTA